MRDAGGEGDEDELIVRSTNRSAYTASVHRAPLTGVPHTVVSASHVRNMIKLDQTECYTQLVVF